MDPYIKQFKEISIADIAVVGGKNSSLGEMFSKLSSKWWAGAQRFSRVCTVPG